MKFSRLNQILPGTGRWASVKERAGRVASREAAGLTEGAQLSADTALYLAWAPSVASRHLPVPGRIYTAPLKHYNDLIM